MSKIKGQAAAPEIKRVINNQWPQINNWSIYSTVNISASHTTVEVASFPAYEAHIENLPERGPRQLRQSSLLARSKGNVHTTPLLMRNLKHAKKVSDGEQD